MRLTKSVAWKHGTRVRLGTPDGPRGVLLRFEKVDTDTGELVTWWSVALQGVLGKARYCRPEDMIVDGVGPHVADACLGCGLPYLTNSLATDGDYLCVRCAADAYGDQSGMFPTADEITFDDRRRRR